ncbi:VOC family protein [candidate division GN15 bacterium]|nr:VOC family protein [candidate division GN15 bacterium]
MAVKPIPDAFRTVTPYLVVDDVPKLLDFLTKAFGATIQERTEDGSGRVMHAQVTIGDSIVMMGQAMEGIPAESCMLYVYTEDVDAWYKKALDAGAVSVREPVNEFYGDRVAGVKDPCGVKWLLATHVEDVSSEEIARRAKNRG